VSSTDHAPRWSWRLATKRNRGGDSAVASRRGSPSSGPRQIHIGGLVLRPRFQPGLITLACALVLIACALVPAAVSALLPPTYAGQVQFLLQPRPELSDTAVERAMLTEEVILTSPSVLGPVAAQAGLSLESLQSKVTTGLVGRSNVLQLTVADGDEKRAVSLVSSIQRQYAAMNVNTAGSASTGGPAITYTVLTPPRLLEKPLAPRPLQVLAAGALVGIGASGLLALILLRPAIPGRRPQEP
jgi:capsular polysaccharide biosynthesis protein